MTMDTLVSSDSWQLSLVTRNKNSMQVVFKTLKACFKYLLLILQALKLKVPIGDEVSIDKQLLSNVSNDVSRCYKIISNLRKVESAM